VTTSISAPHENALENRSFANCTRAATGASDENSARAASSRSIGEGRLRLAAPARLASAASASRALATMQTGEPAEEMVEHLPGIAEPLIDEHEERAEVATGLAVAPDALLRAGELERNARKQRRGERGSLYRKPGRLEAEAVRDDHAEPRDLRDGEIDEHDPPLEHAHAERHVRERDE